MRRGFLEEYKVATEPLFAITLILLHFNASVRWRISLGVE